LLPAEIEYLLNLIITQLEQEPLIIEVEAPVTIAGDTHGQLSDLLRFFNTIGPPPNKKYLFQGDYVDRNPNDVEVIVLLFAYKLRYPEHMRMLRGNHECRLVNQIYGFRDSCKRTFDRDGIKIWRKFCQAFQNLPVCGLIDEKILCMHGGISQRITSIDQLRRTRKPDNIPDEGLLCDLMWADPEPHQTPNFVFNDSRGVGVTFNETAVEEICHKLDIDLISRSHQVVEDGYEFFANRRLVTIFSAPGYMGDFDNEGAMMEVDETLMCKFVRVKSDVQKIVQRQANGLGKKFNGKV
jgi:serine/threonine-protein phosphatase PP1 catalytic subunit